MAAPVHLLLDSRTADSVENRSISTTWELVPPLRGAVTREQEESELVEEPTDAEIFLIRCPLESPTNSPGELVAPDQYTDWFEQALHAVLPTRPVRNSWGDDEEDGEEDLPEDESQEEDEDPDPFEDFDEDDFDDDFDDDFEEELDDEYEIEPKDDGFVLDDQDDEDIDPDLLGDDPDAIGPVADEE